jgi:signal transduction histidine kinase
METSSEPEASGSSAPRAAPDADAPKVPLTRSAALRYLLPVIGVLVALLMAQWLEGLLPDTTVFLVMIVLVAWYGRLAPGLLAALLGTLTIDYYFTPPLYSLNLSRKDVSGLVVFALSAIVVSWASANRRRTQDLLKQARDETEAKVIERTADLKRANEQLQDEIAERKRAQLEIERLAGRLINAQEEERSRIGRELHDHISQRLGLLTIKIDQLRVEPAVTAGTSKALDGLRQQTSQITTDVHRLSHRLHSSMLDYLGLVPALQRLTGEFSERHTIAIDFQHEALSAPLPSEIALCLFRIAEEALHNMVKHSHARTARVALATRGEGLELIVEDTGDGFDPKILEGRAGLGFVSMRERLRLVRGTIRVQSAPGQGTRIEAWVPTTTEPTGASPGPTVLATPVRGTGA